jgi:hypothetical protein
MLPCLVTLSLHSASLWVPQGPPLHLGIFPLVLNCHPGSNIHTQPPTPPNPSPTSFRVLRHSLRPERRSMALAKPMPLQNNVLCNPISIKELQTAKPANPLQSHPYKLPGVGWGRFSEFLQESPCRLRKGTNETCPPAIAGRSRPKKFGKGAQKEKWRWARSSHLHRVPLAGNFAGGLTEGGLPVVCW